MRVIVWVLAGQAALLPLMALAEVPNGKAAKSMLFSAKGAEVEMIAPDVLPADQAELLRSVGVQQPYYGAIAVSPDEGIMVDATVAAANYHSTDAASVAALAGCEAKRKGATPCAVVALIRPKGWEAASLSLSSEATTGFLAEYKGGGAKAFAASTTAGVWGFAAGDGAAAAAIAACAAKSAPPAKDCAVVVAD